MADGRDLDGAAIFDRKTNCCTHLFGCAMLSAFSVDVAARSAPRRYPDMPALDYTVAPDDEALVDSLVRPGHPSTPGFTDPAYPLNSRV